MPLPPGLINHQKIPEELNFSRKSQVVIRLIAIRAMWEVAAAAMTACVCLPFRFISWKNDGFPDGMRPIKEFIAIKKENGGR